MKLFKFNSISPIVRDIVNYLLNVKNFGSFLFLCSRLKFKLNFLVDTSILRNSLYILSWKWLFQQSGHSNCKRCHKNNTNIWKIVVYKYNYPKYVLIQFNLQFLYFITVFIDTICCGSLEFISSVQVKKKSYE